jgi:hypothetical protein
MRPISAQSPIIEFYREEFLKHHRCLQQQRPYYSETAITDVEAALTKIISELEQLSSQEDAPQLVASLLKKFDIVRISWQLHGPASLPWTPVHSSHAQSRPEASEAARYGSSLQARPQCRWLFRRRRRSAIASDEG